MSAPETAIRVAILTVSDSTAAGTRQDLSGPALAARCKELDWSLAAATVVPDNQELITEQLRDWVSGESATLILTTGGTGITARDMTPEATRTVIEKEMPGLGELMRMQGLEQTRFSVLSRAIAGTAGKTLIVNLPGSPSGAVHSFRAIEHLVPHIVRLLAGITEHA